MIKSLHNIQPARGSKRTKKRLGRGDGSGIGSYSGKGIKGQRSRSGGRSGLTARSMKPYLLRIPKVRGKGYASNRVKPSTVNIGDLQKRFNDGDTVTVRSLQDKGLLSKSDRVVKILSHGELSKKLIVKAHGFSAQAQEHIKKAGGSVEKLAGRQKIEKKKSKEPVKAEIK